MPRKRTVPPKTVAWLACTLLGGLVLGSCTAPAPGTGDPTAPPAEASCTDPVADLESRTDLDQQVLFVQHEAFGEQPETTTHVLAPFEPSLTWQAAEPGIEDEVLLPLLDEQVTGMSVDLTPISIDSADVLVENPEDGEQTLVYRFVQPVQLDYTVSCQGEATAYRARVVANAESGTVILDCLDPDGEDAETLATALRQDYC